MPPRSGFRPKSPRPAAALLALAILVALPLSAAAAAAGGGGGSPGPAHSSASVRVGIHEFAFHPHTLTVARGTKVVFANGDPIAHTATSAGNFATGHIRPGHAVAVKFGQSGVFPYHCSIHHFMHGKVVVR
jgi:plastocyanin